MPVVTLVDTLGIQPFVFASNRLKDVVGGSWLVEEATAQKRWLNELGYGDNVIVGAGGNVLLRFDGLDSAKAFAARLSRTVIERAPGLELAVAHQEYATGQLARAIRDVQIAIEKHKLERRPSVPLLGLGVTATCRETRLPATRVDQKSGFPIAAGVFARRSCRQESDERWHPFLPYKEGQETFSCADEEPVALAFPLELDELGRTSGDTSLMGVVHIDGNGIGPKIQQWLKNHIQKGTADETVRREYQDISNALKKLGDTVLTALCQRVGSAIRWVPPQDPKKTGQYTLRSPLFDTGFTLTCRIDNNTGERTLYLPIRPVLLGGDDLTFVCDGRIALDLATTALTQFEQTAPLAHIGSVRACAGAALVKTHTPFSRSYSLAESLCESAKQHLRSLKENKRHTESALDWHIGLASPTETLAELRQRQYNVFPDEERKRQSPSFPILTCRPYLLGNSGTASPEPETWRWLAEEVLGQQGNGFHTNDPEQTSNWRAHRSKLKTLRELAREGRAAVENTLTAWQVAHPQLALPDAISDGFIESRTPLLDAIELLDIHFPLDEVAS